MISALALTVSIISAAFSYQLQSIDSKRATREQLSNVSSELIGLTREAAQMYQVPVEEHDSLYYQKLSSITHSAMLLSRQAIYLAEEQPNIVTDVEYLTIASGLVLAGDLRANDYWQRAIKAAPTPYSEMVNTRAYANFLFNQGRHESGRIHYQKALNLMDNNTDLNKYNNAYTYQMWMYSEATHHFPEESNRNHIMAKRIYETISRPILKQQGLAGLESTYKQTSSLSVPEQPLLPQP
jgi:hypothetical protein